MDAVKTRLMGLVSGREYESADENCSIEGSKMVLKDSDGFATPEHVFNVSLCFTCFSGQTVDFCYWAEN